MGRQPWLVFGLLTTTAGVSPSVSPGMILFTLLLFLLLYAVLAVLDATLLFKYARQDVATAEIKLNVDEQDEALSITF